MRVLIIGLGSIAGRHINALKCTQMNVKCYALRSNQYSKKMDNISDLYSWVDVPDDIDFVIISNPTDMHHQTILKCLELGVPLFIEKPPLMNLIGANELIRKIKENNIVTL